MNDNAKFLKDCVTFAQFEQLELKVEEKAEVENLHGLEADM